MKQQSKLVSSVNLKRYMALIFSFLFLFTNLLPTSVLAKNQNYMSVYVKQGNSSYKVGQIFNPTDWTVEITEAGKKRKSYTVSEFVKMGGKVELDGKNIYNEKIPSKLSSNSATVKFTLPGTKGAYSATINVPDIQYGFSNEESINDHKKYDKDGSWYNDMKKDESYSNLTREEKRERYLRGTNTKEWTGMVADQAELSKFQNAKLISAWDVGSFKTVIKGEPIYVDGLRAKVQANGNTSNVIKGKDFSSVGLKVEPSVAPNKPFKLYVVDSHGRKAFVRVITPVALGENSNNDGRKPGDDVGPSSSIKYGAHTMSGSLVGNNGTNVTKLYWHSFPAKVGYKVGETADVYGATVVYNGRAYSDKEIPTAFNITIDTFKDVRGKKLAMKNGDIIAYARKAFNSPLKEEDKYITVAKDGDEAYQGIAVVKDNGLLEGGGEKWKIPNHYEANEINDVDADIKANIGDISKCIKTEITVKLNHELKIEDFLTGEPLPKGVGLSLGNDVDTSKPGQKEAKLIVVVNQTSAMDSIYSTVNVLDKDGNKVDSVDDPLAQDSPKSDDEIAKAKTPEEALGKDISQTLNDAGYSDQKTEPIFENGKQTGCKTTCTNPQTGKQVTCLQKIQSGGNCNKKGNCPPPATQPENNQPASQPENNQLENNQPENKQQPENSKSNDSQEQPQDDKEEKSDNSKQSENSRSSDKQPQSKDNSEKDDSKNSEKSENSATSDKQVQNSDNKESGSEAADSDNSARDYDNSKDSINKEESKSNSDKANKEDKKQKEQKSEEKQDSQKQDEKQEEQKDPGEQGSDGVQGPRQPADTQPPKDEKPNEEKPEERDKRIKDKYQACIEEGKELSVIDNVQLVDKNGNPVKLPGVDITVNYKGTSICQKDGSVKQSDDKTETGQTDKTGNYKLKEDKVYSPEVKVDKLPKDWTIISDIDKPKITGKTYNVYIDNPNYDPSIDPEKFAPGEAEKNKLKSNLESMKSILEQNPDLIKNQKELLDKIDKALEKLDNPNMTKEDTNDIADMVKDIKNDLENGLKDSNDTESNSKDNDNKQEKTSDNNKQEQPSDNNENIPPKKQDGNIGKMVENDPKKSKSPIKDLVDKAARNLKDNDGKEAEKEQQKEQQQKQQPEQQPEQPQQPPQDKPNSNPEENKNKENKNKENKNEENKNEENKKDDKSDKNKTSEKDPDELGFDMIQLKPGSTYMTKWKDGKMLDDQKVSLDSVPENKDGHIYAPIRFIAETLGVKVEWDNATKEITIVDGDRVVKVNTKTNKWTDNNGKSGEFKPPMYMKHVKGGDRSMLSLRAIGDVLGMSVGQDPDDEIYWDNKNKMMNINLKNKEKAKKEKQKQENNDNNKIEKELNMVGLSREMTPSDLSSLKKDNNDIEIKPESDGVTVIKDSIKYFYKNGSGNKLIFSSKN